MQFIKTRQVKSPERNVEENAGIDFYIPDLSEKFVDDLAEKNISAGNKFMIIGCASIHDPLAGLKLAELNKSNYISRINGVIGIAPHSSIIIPTGIKSKFEKNLALIANNKSGIATKKKLVFGASVIDCSYQGEWHINLINTSDEYQTLECGQKAIQFIPHLISTDPVEIVEATEEEFYTEKTSRGEGWQGSTGIK